MEAFSARRSYRPLLFIYTVVIVFLGAALAGAAVFLFLPSRLGDSYGAVHSAVRDMGQVLAAKVAGIYSIMAVFIALAVVLLHLFYSHRIAGPAYRLSREATVLGQGNLKGNIRFRRKDNLTDMAESLNQVASHYRDSVSIMKDRIAAIEKQAGSIAQLVESGESASVIERSVQDINMNLKNLTHAVLEIRT